jgi:hypothetical protein
MGFFSKGEEGGITGICPVALQQMINTDLYSLCHPQKNPPHTPRRTLISNLRLEILSVVCYI